MDYVVKEGDTLFLIAQRFGVTLSDLINANPQIENPDIIYPGQTVRVPVPPGGPDVGVPGERPLRFVSATEDSRPLQNSASVPVRPKITLTFDKNVVGDNVWENNQNAITLRTNRNVDVPVRVTRIPEEVDFSQRQKIFVEPVNALSRGTAFTLNISPNLRSKAGETIGETTGGQGVSINFSTSNTTNR